jgi:beta-galactosidase
MEDSERFHRFEGGVSYYPDHWPREEWERDMKLIKQSGLSLIRFGEFSWYWLEPEEGRFDFSGLDHFMELAASLDLNIVLCTPTAAPPEWLLRRYPHVRYRDANGLPHRGGRHMICYHDPDGKRLAERIIVAMAERYKDHPALFAWQIDNEPTLGESKSRERFYDYHPETVRRFRQYLREKYGTTRALNDLWQNHFWSRAWSDWDEVDPPAEPGIPSLWLEWMRFRDRIVNDWIQWQLDLLRGVKPDFIIGTNIPEVSPTASIWLAQDYFGQCRGLDYAGIDVYVHKRDRRRELRELAFSCDLIRSAADAAGSAFWVSETQAGPHRLPWMKRFAGGLWGADFLRDSTIACAAHGARKILYFLWRPTIGGQEFGMNGMVHADGSPHEITLAVKEILKEAESAAARHDGKRTVYVHYSRDSLLLASGYDPCDTWESTLRGWHALLMELGFRIQFMDDRGLRQMNWQKGDLCVLPYSLVLDEPAAEGIKRAIEAGATVVSGYATGFFTPYGTIRQRIPGFGLDERFGVRNRGADLVREGDGIRIAGTPIVVDALHSELELLSGDVICAFSTGKPAVVRNRNALYVGFDAGTLYMNGAPDRQRDLLRLLGPLLSVDAVEEPAKK